MASVSCRANGCHADVAETLGLHTRVAETSCTMCHVATGESSDPEGGKPANHVFQPITGDGGVCQTCHAERPSKSSVHEPFLKGQCLSCHNPHGNPAITRENEAAVCARCHEPRHDSVAHAPYVAGDCSSCHAGHEAPHRPLLRETTAELCLRCHDKKLEAPGDPTAVADIATTIRTARFKHGPIRAGECSCHDAHGSNHPNLLEKAFPAAFYQTYDEANYALCFDCHGSALARQRNTTTATKFRHGDLNLHYLHVNHEKGRSCRACHETHASDLPFHMRKSVPFGGWNVPIDFQAHANGGTCATGCHQSKSYDRSAVPAAPVKEDGR